MRCIFFPCRDFPSSISIYLSKYAYSWDSLAILSVSKFFTSLRVLKLNTLWLIKDRKLLFMYVESHENMTWIYLKSLRSRKHIVVILYWKWIPHNSKINFLIYLYVVHVCRYTYAHVNMCLLKICILFWNSLEYFDAFLWTINLCL